ncbi:MAG: large conductance mechanosensitive channel protein MscL [Clostridia bacterium]|nr:large conductance mechanosensitive channel protein MscL [Clostridia bacterium]
MKKFLNEFKAFAMKGNVVDMAIGVVIGAAFKAIVDSLVGDVISPLVGLLFKNNFADLMFKVGEVEIKYGSFITAIVNFLIVAFVLFTVIKSINAAKKITEKKPEPEAPKAPTTKVCPFCKSEIAIDATRCPHCTSELK